MNKSQQQESEGVMTNRVNMSWNDWNSQLEKARADEREKVLSEIEKWIDERPTINIFDENSSFVSKKDVLAKLNQLKEG